MTRQGSTGQAGMTEYEERVEARARRFYDDPDLAYDALLAAGAVREDE